MGFLENLHFPLDSDEFQLLGGAVTVVEEELLAGLDDSLGENADAMVAVHHNHFGVAIRVDRVISEADFVPLPSRIDDEIVVQVEQKAARVLVVDLAASIGLVLRDYFTAIFLRVKQKCSLDNGKHRKLIKKHRKLMKNIEN